MKHLQEGAHFVYLYSIETLIKKGLAEVDKVFKEEEITILLLSDIKEKENGILIYREIPKYEQESWKNPCMLVKTTQNTLYIKRILKEENEDNDWKEISIEHIRCTIKEVKPMPSYKVVLYSIENLLKKGIIIRNPIKAQRKKVPYKAGPEFNWAITTENVKNWHKKITVARTIYKREEPLSGTVFVMSNGSSWVCTTNMIKKVL